MALDSASISAGHHPPAHTDMDMDEEDEVDQLDSDLDRDDEMASGGGHPLSSKSRPRRTGERVPGRTLIPSTRVENIMHADGSGGHMSKEALFMLSIATEEFVKRLAEAGQSIASSERRSVVSYRDVASATQQRQEFNFLHEMIPIPTTLTQALERRAAREKELADDDPALAPSLAEEATSTAIMPQNAVYNQKTKTRSRLSNGKEKANGTASASASRRQRDSKGRWSQNGRNGEDEANGDGSVSAGTRPASVRIRTKSARASEAQQPASAQEAHHQNGTGSASWGGMPPPAVPNAQLLSAGPRPEESWSPAHYTGPASGYLEDHRMMFNGSRGNGMTDAPGRTIYSHQRSPPMNR